MGEKFKLDLLADSKFNVSVKKVQCNVYLHFTLIKMSLVHKHTFVHAANMALNEQQGKDVGRGSEAVNV